MKVKQNVMKGIEGLAEYLAKNSVKTSMPIFSHKVVKTEGIEEHIQRLGEGKSME